MSFGFPPIPDPQLKSVHNDTPFAHMFFDKMGKGRLFYDVVVCKATFEIAQGKLKPVPRHPPIELADRYWDEDRAETSSLRIAGDVLLHKPGTDVTVTGFAKPHDLKPRKEWNAGIRVTRGEEKLLEHGMRLLGPRAWFHSAIGGWKLSDPVPTAAVALRHELSYGGNYPNDASKLQGDKTIATDELTVFEANPSGCGHWNVKQLNKTIMYPGPQIEVLNQPVGNLMVPYPLASPSPVARFWESRTQYAGTYDDAWHMQFQRSAIPDFPVDFDYRYYQCAHPNLIHPEHLHGDEKIYLIGLLAGPAQTVACELPGIQMQAELIAADGSSQDRAMSLDTIHVDLDANTISLTWRLTLDQRECIEHVGLYQVENKVGKKETQRKVLT
jgi:hypothetical protein